MKRLASIGIAAALAVGGFVAAAPAMAAQDGRAQGIAPAASCLIGDKTTSTKAANSTVFTTAGSSVCKDLNAAFGFSYADKILGQYYTSSGWKSGSRGYVSVPKTDPGWGKWTVLISDLARGTSVRGVAAKYVQTVRYVW
jgi:hypothetical protein